MASKVVGRRRRRGGDDCCDDVTSRAGRQQVRRGELSKGEAQGAVPSPPQEGRTAPPSLDLVDPLSISSRGSWRSWSSRRQSRRRKGRHLPSFSFLSLCLPDFLARPTPEAIMGQNNEPRRGEELDKRVRETPDEDVTRENISEGDFFKLSGRLDVSFALSTRASTHGLAANLVLWKACGSRPHCLPH